MRMSSCTRPTLAKNILIGQMELWHTEVSETALSIRVMLENEYQCTVCHNHHNNPPQARPPEGC